MSSTPSIAPASAAGTFDPATDANSTAYVQPHAITPAPARYVVEQSYRKDLVNSRRLQLLFLYTDPHDSLMDVICGVDRIFHVPITTTDDTAASAQTSDHRSGRYRFVEHTPGNKAIHVIPATDIVIERSDTDGHPTHLTVVEGRPSNLTPGRYPLEDLGITTFQVLTDGRLPVVDRKGNQVTHISMVPGRGQHFGSVGDTVSVSGTCAVSLHTRVGTARSM